MEKIIHNTRLRYKGYDYLLTMVHWGVICRKAAYVRLPQNHTLLSLVKRAWQKHPITRKRIVSFNASALDDHIHVHGGLTFAQKITEKNKKQYFQDFTPGFWIGWDYSHFMDAIFIEKEEDVAEGDRGMWRKIGKYATGGKHRTIFEMDQDAKSAIDKLWEFLS